MQNNSEENLKCKWTNLNDSLNYSVECLKDKGFVNIRNLSKKRGIPMGTVLKQCVFCGNKIEFVNN